MDLLILPFLSVPLVAGYLMYHHMRAPKHDLASHEDEITPRLLATLPPRDAQRDEVTSPIVHPILKLTHKRRLGRLTYTMEVTLPGRHVLPQGVISSAFALTRREHRPDQHGIPYYALLTRHTGGTHFNANAYRLLDRLLDGFDRHVLFQQEDDCKGFKAHDVIIGADDILWKFSLSDNLFERIPRSTTKRAYIEEAIDLFVDVFSPVVHMLSRVDARFDDEREMWRALHGVASDRDDSLYCLEQFLRDPSPNAHMLYNRVCKLRGDHEEVVRLYTHDPSAVLSRVESFVALQLAIHLIRERLITCELFAEQFHGTLSPRVLEDANISVRYRAALLKKWLTLYDEGSSELAAVHKIMEAMSAREQAELRAELEDHQVLSGALTASSGTQGGELTTSNSAGGGKLSLEK